MKVRVLVEQRAHPGLDRQSLGSGEVHDLPQGWAKELLNRGDAEPVSAKESQRAERRGGETPGEKR